MAQTFSRNPANKSRTVDGRERHVERAEQHEPERARAGQGAVPADGRTAGGTDGDGIGEATRR